MEELVISMQWLFMALQAYIQIQSRQNQLLLATRLRCNHCERRLCLRREVIIEEILILNNERVSVSLC